MMEKAGWPGRGWLRRAGIGSAAVAVVLGVAFIAAHTWVSRAATPPAPSTEPPPGSFRPTEAQWRGLKIAPVVLVTFRSERLTEGNIAIDDDLTTPVFSPYSGRVTRLIARLGDTVERGAPLFEIQATEFVQAANTLITAVAALKT